MDRKLINYLPPVLRDITEFNAINNANEPAISLAWNSLDRVMANQFLDDADEWGVSVWEKELKIFPKDTDTLELRKARIKAMWNRELPYTLPWLRKWLAGTCGGKAVLEKSGYRLRIDTDGAELSEDLKAMIRQAIPANLLYIYATSFQGGTSTRGRFSAVSLTIWSHIFNLRGIPPICFDGSTDFGGELFFDQQLVSTVYQAPMCFDGGQTFGGSIFFDRQVAGSFRTIALWMRVGTRTINRPRLPGIAFRMDTGFREDTPTLLAVRIRVVGKGGVCSGLLAGSKAVNAGGGRLLPAVRGRAETPERPRAAPSLRIRTESAGRLHPRRTMVQAGIHCPNTATAILRVDTLYTFAGEYGFDGERRFNADIINL